MSRLELSEKAQEMLQNLPTFYENIYEMQTIMQVSSVEFSEFRQRAVRHLNATAVSIANEEWLPFWERDMNIHASLLEPREQRVSRLHARLRGSGTVTSKLLVAIAASYSNGTIAVTELQNIIRITFIDARGIPEFLKDLQQAFESLIPAHVAIEYVFRYLTWKELESLSWTWSELDASALTWEQLEVYSP